MTCDSMDAKNWKSFPFPSGDWNYYIDDEPTSADPHYTQPVQGPLFPNCTFISALIALTWVNKDFIICKMGITDTTMSPNPAGTCNKAFYNGYKFWDGATEKLVKINDTLLVESEGSNNRCGAYSKETYELWISFIEKAYAKFCHYKYINSANYPAAGWLDNAAKNPEKISTMTRNQWGGNPTTVLAHLTGCTTKKNIYVPNAPPADCRPAPATHYDYIKKCLCTDAGGTFVRRTKYPAVAWTYSSGNQFGGTCGIAANHCYALLGCLDYGGYRYIVLRDTFGTDPAGCNQIPPEAPWTYLDAEYNICTKFSVPTAFHATNTWLTRYFYDQNDAVFGLREDDLSKYFEYYGYVK